MKRISQPRNREEFKERMAQLLKSAQLFVQSRRSKEFLTFLFFLFLATLFWMLQSLEEVSTSRFKVPLHYTHVPQNTMFIEEMPQEVEMRLQDNGSVLLGYFFNGFSPIEIDFQRFEESTPPFTIQLSQAAPNLKSQLKNSTLLLSTLPDSIMVSYTREPGKRVLIKRLGAISTAINSIQHGEIALDHDSATVYAPAEILERTTAIYTETITLTELTDTTIQPYKLQKIRGAKIEPTSVTATIPVEELIYKELTLPIKVENLPLNNLSVLTFPATIQLSCLMPVSLFPQIKESDFRVAVDCEQILNTSAQSKLKVEIVKQPLVVSNMLLSPDSVEYIIEEIATEIPNL